MDFGDVIKEMKAHPEKRFARKGWNGRGIYIQLLVPDRQDRMTHPYIYIDTTGLQSDNPDAPRDLVPWLASQTDMLADDWMEMNPFNTPEEQRQRIMECKNRMFEEMKGHVPGMFCLGYHPTRNSINDYGWMMMYITNDALVDRKDIVGNALAGPPQYFAYGLYFRIEKEERLDGLLFDVLTHNWDGPMPNLVPREEVKE